MSKVVSIRRKKKTVSQKNSTEGNNKSPDVTEIYYRKGLKSKLQTEETLLKTHEDLSASKAKKKTQKKSAISQFPVKLK